MLYDITLGRKNLFWEGQAGGQVLEFYLVWSKVYKNRLE